MHAMICAMKLRITKGRIACAVVLLPMLYLLNVGPVVYLEDRFHTPHEIYGFLYGRVNYAIGGIGPTFGTTRFWEVWVAYQQWWSYKALGIEPTSD
jgi:hypothetical protein